jgi:hypothetical protein
MSQFAARMISQRTDLMKRRTLNRHGHVNSGRRENLPSRRRCVGLRTEDHERVRAGLGSVRGVFGTSIRADFNGRRLRISPGYIAGEVSLNRAVFH